MDELSNHIFLITVAAGLFIICLFLMAELVKSDKKQSKMEAAYINMAEMFGSFKQEHIKLKIVLGEFVKLSDVLITVADRLSSDGVDKPYLDITMSEVHKSYDRLQKTVNTGGVLDVFKHEIDATTE